MKSVSAGLRVGYVLKVFPRLSETFILNEILELETQGVDVEIFSLNPPNDSRFHGRLERLRANITYLPRADSSDLWRAVRDECAPMAIDAAAGGSALLHGMRAADPGGMKLFFQALLIAARAKRRGVEHLHAHFATSAAHVALLAHMVSGVSFSFTAHAKDIYHIDFDHLLVKDALERAAFAATVTDYNVARLEELSPAATGKVHRIYNGLPLGEIQPAPQPVSDPPMVVSVGRLVEKKGFPYLIEACRILKDRGRRFRCAIIGAGEGEKKLSDLIRRLEADDVVRLLGPQSQDAVLETIRESSLMVLPCIVGEDGNRDALPTVLLEAMALGRPVVSTDLAGVTEIVDHGETGLLAPQRDAPALASAIDRLLADPQLRQSMGRAARRKAERFFDLSCSVRELAGLFATAAARGRELNQCA